MKRILNHKDTPVGVVLAGCLIGLAVLTGCGDKAMEPFKDAERGDTNDDPADVIQMPDGFNNLATKCDHGNRVYVTFHGDSPYGSVAVVPDADC